VEKKRPSKKPRFFYGYWLLAASFLMTLIHTGCGVFVFSLFVRPIQADLGWSRGTIMLAFTIHYMLVGVASPFIGRLVDRHGARMVVFFGALIAGAGFVVISLMNSLWQFCLGYAIAGVGLAAVGHVPASAMISNWFKKRRGMAIGVMAAGIGAGGLVMAPPLSGYFIPNFGWSGAYLALAIITCAVLIPLALFVIKNKPADIGLYPDGAEAPDVDTVSEASLPVAGGMTLRMALATPTFWLIVLTYLPSAFSQCAIIQHQVPHLEDIGFSPAIAATTIGGAGLGSAIGKFGFGWLCDHMPAKYACLIGLCLQVLAIIIFMNIGPASSVAMLWLYAIMIGLGMGCWLPTMAMLTSTNFGLSSYGAIFGMLAFVQAFGVSIGPLVLGYMYDTMNTYHWAFILLVSLYAISIPSALALRRPKPFQINSQTGSRQ